MLAPVAGSRERVAELNVPNRSPMLWLFLRKEEFHCQKNQEKEGVGAGGETDKK